jgi:hypothetical protein
VVEKIKSERRFFCKDCIIHSTRPGP